MAVSRGKLRGGFAQCQVRCVASGDQSRGDGFHVAFYARNLAGEENIRDVRGAAAWV